jgi:hypothetical protein
MNVIDLNAQYSILGTAVRLDRVDGRMLVLHAPLRLGPGRTVSIRNGATTFQATVLNAHVVALHAEQGATYEICAEMTASPACPAEAPTERRRPVDLEASKKGGSWRAA